MYVRNRIGFNFAFKYRNATITIPYDGKIYSIPNDCDRFKELAVIMPMHIKTQEVIYIKVDGTISDKVNGPKRSGRPPRKDKHDRTGKRFARRGNVKRKNNPDDTTPTPLVDSEDTAPINDASVVDVDLDSLITSQEPVIIPDTSKDNSVSDKKKTNKKTTTKKSTTKTKTKAKKSTAKRGRPRKK